MSITVFDLNRTTLVRVYTVNETGNIVKKIFFFISLFIDRSNRAYVRSEQLRRHTVVVFRGKLQTFRVGRRRRRHVRVGRFQKNACQVRV